MTMTNLKNEDDMVKLQGKKPNFPFDLNKLFSMDYSFDILKQAIEYLAN